MWRSCWPYPSTSLALSSVTSMTPGISWRTFSMNCWEPTWVPETYRAFTFSLFHRSMKLSSCVLGGGGVGAGDVEDGRAAHRHAETLQLRNDAVLHDVLTDLLAQDRDLLALQRVLLLQKTDQDGVVRSGVVPGRMMRPGGDWLMMACVRSKVNKTVL